MDVEKRKIAELRWGVGFGVVLVRVLVLIVVAKFWIFNHGQYAVEAWFYKKPTVKFVNAYCTAHGLSYCIVEANVSLESNAPTAEACTLLKDFAPFWQEKVASEDRVVSITISWELNGVSIHTEHAFGDDSQTEIDKEISQTCELVNYSTTVAETGAAGSISSITTYLDTIDIFRHDVTAVPTELTDTPPKESTTINIKDHYSINGWDVWLDYSTADTEVNETIKKLVEQPPPPGTTTPKIRVESGVVVEGPITAEATP